MNATALAAENQTLSALIVSLQQSLASLQEQFAATQQENKLLRQKLDAFLRRYFGGGKSEAFDPKQLELLLAEIRAASAPIPTTEAEIAAVPTRSAASAPRKPAARAPLPEHLPIERVVLEPEPVRAQPEAFKKIGEEVTEELDWKPAQFFRRLYIRPKYVRRKNALPSAGAAEEPAVLIAPLPARLIERGLPGAGLLAQVLISKYEDHLPLYRQEKIYGERHGVKLPRQTLAAWVEQGARWLQPVYEAMKRSLRRGDYLQADETPIRYLDPDLPGKAQIGYLWTYSRPGAEVVFEWNTSRGRDGPETFLKGFAGRLQTDGYGVYEALARARPELVLVGCWAHARRKFVEALEEDRRAASAVRQIAVLYRIEKRLREERAGPRLRAAVRASEAQPALARLERLLRRWQPQVLPKSLLGTAIEYALARWAELSRYVAHGAVEIDNNLVENAIRPSALGKKNWLFIGHPEAGWRSAVIYSVVGSCRRYGVDPHEYLRDVLCRLPAMKITEIETVTPAAWAKAKKAAARNARQNS